MAIPITWGTPKNPNQHHKLQKAPPKQVHFTPLPSTADATFSPSSIPGLDPITGLPTPDASPTQKPPKKKSSLISRLLPSRSAAPPSPALTDDAHGGQFNQEEPIDGDTWHHHPSYFPEYEPIYRSPTSIPGDANVTGHDRYFPDYTPINHSSHPIHQYPGVSSAVAYALSTPEAQAASHAARVGHSVAIHYPDLPRFADYTAQGGQGGGGKGWTSGRWGVEGWTGYGWEGEKLPDKDGMVFGAPMAKGTPLPWPGESGKKKGKPEPKGDGEGGGGDAEGQATTEGGDAKKKSKKKKK